MKGLFANVPMHGHVIPTLRVAEELVGLGHDVGYWLTPDFEESVAACGAVFYAYPSDLTDLPALISTGTIVMEVLREAVHFLPDIYEVAKKEQPDYVVADSTCVWAPVLARALDVPLVSTHPTCVAEPQGSFVAPSRELRFFPPEDRFYFYELNRLYTQLYQALGLSFSGPNDAQMYPGDLVVVFVPDWFDEEAGNATERFFYNGPCLAKASSRPRAGPTCMSNLPATKKLAYVSFGTIYNNQPEIYRKCIEAFAGDGNWHVLLSAGKAFENLAQRVLPENVTLCRSVDQLAALIRSDLFISHGGMNSLMEAFAAGVPSICSPMMREQLYNAERSQALGLSTTVDLSTCSLAALREVISQTLGDRSMVQKLQLVRARLISADGAALAANRIDGVIRSRER